VDEEGPVTDQSLEDVRPGWAFILSLSSPTISPMREGQRFSKDWLRPGERWPGERDGVPEPGTPESAEYHRKAWEEEHPTPEPPPRNPPLSETSKPFVLCLESETHEQEYARHARRLTSTPVPAPAPAPPNSSESSKSADESSSADE